jgi:hypothetical protein
MSSIIREILASYQPTPTHLTEVQYNSKAKRPQFSAIKEQRQERLSAAAPCDFFVSGQHLARNQVVVKFLFKTECHLFSWLICGL